MLGGATDLKKGKAGWYAGDLSGILAKKRPFWFQTFYKPGDGLLLCRTGIKSCMRSLNMQGNGILVISWVYRPGARCVWRW